MKNAKLLRRKDVFWISNMYIVHCNIYPDKLDFLIFKDLRGPKVAPETTHESVLYLLLFSLECIGTN